MTCGDVTTESGPQLADELVEVDPPPLQPVIASERLAQQRNGNERHFLRCEIKLIIMTVPRYF
jgi:hypothetical protein